MSFPDAVQRLTVAKLTVGELIALSGNSVTKQGAVSGSDFTTTSASFVNVTGCSITTGGAGIVIVSAQIVAAASVTTAQLKVNTTGSGTITGVWIGAVDTATAGDITAFGVTFGATSANFATANTYEVIFIGYVSAAGTYTLQAESDGTRTLTVKVNSQIASNI